MSICKPLLYKIIYKDTLYSESSTVFERFKIACMKAIKKMQSSSEILILSGRRGVFHAVGSYCEH